MGSSNRTLTVKVPRDKLIEALGKAANDRKKSVTEYEASQKQYKKDTENAKQDFLKRLKLGNVKMSDIEISVSTPFSRSDNQDQLSISMYFKVAKGAIKLPSEPKNKYHQNNYGWSVNNDIEEIEGAIRILNLSTDEFVSTSTYKSVAQFL